MTPTTEFSRIFDIVERWVTDAPGRDALAFGDQSWTWAQLDDRVRRAAGALRASGLGPGDRLAVLDKNHPACLELTLAASLIGSASFRSVLHAQIQGFQPDCLADYSMP